ncbi:MAG: hypothetical protein WEA61_05890 [Anaerolineales bacterium]
MKIIWPWEREKVERELSSVEGMLASAFKPVAARPAFMNDLRKRLVGNRNPFARAGLSTLEIILMIGGAIVGAVVLVFTLIRSIGGLFGRLRPGGLPKEPQRKITREPKKRAA